MKEPFSVPELQYFDPCPIAAAAAAAAAIKQRAWYDDII
jgi:hypothetical protein